MHHLHYFVQRAAAHALHRLLAGGRLTAAFSQQRDECVLGFGLPDGSDFFLRIGCGNGNAYLMPTARFNRARANSADVLPDAIGLHVSGVFVAPFERLLCLDLSADPAPSPTLRLVIRLHKHQSNIIMYRSAQPVEAFRHDLPADLHLPQPALLYGLDAAKADADYTRQRTDRLRAVAQAPPETRAEAIRKAFPVLDAAMRTAALAAPAKGEMGQHLDSCLAQWEAGWLQLAQCGDAVDGFLTPLPNGYQVIEPQPKDILAQLEQLCRMRFAQGRRSALRRDLLELCEGHVRRLTARLTAAEQAELAESASARYETYGHMLLAYLHLVPEGADRAELPDFETGEPVRIALNADLTPQANAEVYYRKSKDVQARRQALATRTAADYKALDLWQDRLTAVQQAQDARQLEALHKTWGLADGPASHRHETQEGPVFRRFIHQGYLICVGRNAKNNDELTFGWAHKNDLWFHARDVKGSHVVIRRPDVRPVPPPVVAFAAGLAAYFSKAKGSAMVPVSVTERKYVRKSKGMAPGAVLMERETVVMAEPVMPEGE